MILEKLLENIPCEVKGRTDIDITDIEFDSRKAGKGSLFFCITSAVYRRFVEKKPVVSPV